ncbi:MAG TPA: hypothetical protein VGF94_15360, partial [Kofleriaceae bacterium]
ERSLAPGFQLPHVHAIQAACNVDLYAGDAAAAASRLEGAWPELERFGILRIQLVRVELQLLRARIALADTTRPVDDRGKLARGLAEAVIKEDSPWAVGTALAVRASAQAMRGELDAAHGALVASEELLAAAEMRGMLQVVRLRRAQLEGGPGGGARAAAARDALADLGAREPERVAALLVPWDA